MRRRSAYLLLAVPALLGVIVAVPHATAGPRVGEFAAELAPVNQNAQGVVSVVQKGTTLEVDLSASGLDGGVHLAHLHGVRKAENECPSLALDKDGNGLVDIGEGLPAYGPVQVTLSQGTNDRGTSLDYSRTYVHLDSGDGTASLGDLDHYTIVVHGVDLDGDGLATNPDAGGDGPGDTDDNEISMPALCGTVEVAH